MRIGRKLCGYLGCQQVHLLYPDLPMTRRLRDDPEVIWEQRVSIFIPETAEREESCVCGVRVVVPPVGVLSLALSHYEEWKLGDFEQELYSAMQYFQDWVRNELSGAGSV